MAFSTTLDNSPMILMEAAVIENLWHDLKIPQHPSLDNHSHMLMDDIDDGGQRLLDLNRTWGVPILGGCCGTRLPHLEYLVDNLGV
jgi:hypothetical protein